MDENSFSHRFDQEAWHTKSYIWEAGLTLGRRVIIVRVWLKWDPCHVVKPLRPLIHPLDGLYWTDETKHHNCLYINPHIRLISSFSHLLLTPFPFLSPVSSSSPTISSYSFSLSSISSDEFQIGWLVVILLMGDGGGCRSVWRRWWWICRFVQRWWCINGGVTLIMKKMTNNMQILKLQFYPLPIMFTNYGT